MRNVLRRNLYLSNLPKIKYTVTVLADDTHITPIRGSYNDVDINWGDGNTDTNVTGSGAGHTISHTYTTGGTYQITISVRSIVAFNCAGSGTTMDQLSRDHVISVDEFGEVGVTSFANQWESCTNLVSASNYKCTTATSAYRQFMSCSSMTSPLDMQNCNPAGFTSLYEQYRAAGPLTTVPDLTGFTNVTTMYQWWGVKSTATGTLNCSDLTSLQTGGSAFGHPNNNNSAAITITGVGNMSSLTDASSMFSRLTHATLPSGLDLTGLTSLQIASSMFNYCGINAAGTYEATLGTHSSLTSANRMFGVTRITNIPSFSGLTNCTNFGAMFTSCNDLVNPGTINLTGLGSATTTASMFQYCNNLAEDFPDFSPLSSGFTNMASMFNRCYDMTGGPDLSKIHPDAQFTCSDAFNDCWALSAQPVLHSGITNMTRAFMDIPNTGVLIELPDLTRLGPTCTTINSCFEEADIFKGTANLSTLSEVTTATLAFQRAYGLTNVSGLNGLTSLTDPFQMFFQCTGLKSVLDNNVDDITSCTTTYRMFYGCTNLEGIPATMDGWTGVTTAQEMFWGCTKLKNAYDFAGWSSLTNLSLTYYNCDALTSAAPLSGLTSLNTIDGIYQECGGITDVTDLHGMSSGVFTELNDFGDALKNCTAITSALPTWWDDFADPLDKDGAFEGCTSASNYGDVPIGWR